MTSVTMMVETTSIASFSSCLVSLAPHCSYALSCCPILSRLARPKQICYHNDADDDVNDDDDDDVCDIDSDDDDDGGDGHDNDDYDDGDDGNNEDNDYDGNGDGKMHTHVSLYFPNANAVATLCHADRFSAEGAPTRRSPKTNWVSSL